MSDLIEEQSKLQKQGLKIIENLNLKEILGKYGEFCLVGSMDYGLMTWRDIDVDLVTENEPRNEEYLQIVEKLFSQPNVKKLSLIDDRESEDPNRPDSMYIGVKYEDEYNDTWKIDIRLLSRKNIVTDKTKKLIDEKMTEESRNNILLIKSGVHDNPKYHKKFFSVDIYEAVLLFGVREMEGFKEYLSKQGKSL
ncbi:MAG: hypothetical protein WCK48_02370 [bacterium]